MCSIRSARPTTGSPCAWNQPASTSGRANQTAQGADQQQVEQPVEHGRLALVVLGDLVAEQRNDRAVQLSAGTVSSVGSDRSSRSLISPVDAYVPTSITELPSTLLPQVRTPWSIASARSSP